MEEATSKKNYFKVLFLSFAFIFSYFYIVCVKLRFLAGDEGYFAFAGKAVSEGKILYKDFFYPQAPLYPYFLSFWKIIFGETFSSFRLSSCVLCSLIAILIFDIVYRQRKDLKLAGFSVITFCMTDLVFSYFSLIKNYSLSSFFILVSVWFYFSKQKNKYFWISFFITLASQVRSYVCVVIFAFLIQMLFCDGLDKKQKWQEFKKMFLGGLLGILPTILFLIFCFDEFVFNNVTYHSLRNPDGLIGNIDQKINLFKAIFTSYSLRTSHISLQFAFLLLLILLKKINFKSINFKVFVLLFLISFLPTPAYSQYFVMLVSFLILYLFEKRGEYQFINEKLLKAVASCLWILFFVYGTLQANRYLISGRKVSGIYMRKYSRIWKPEKIDEIIKTISKDLSSKEFNEGNKNLDKRKLILSSWPGYMIGIDGDIFRGMENHFARTIAKKLSLEDREKYKIYDTAKGIAENISPDKIQYLLVGYRDKANNFRETALQKKYKIKRFGIVALMYKEE